MLCYNYNYNYYYNMKYGQSMRKYDAYAEFALPLVDNEEGPEKPSSSDFCSLLENKNIIK